MAEINILLQGLRAEDDHESAINSLLEVKDIDNYLFSIAFVRSAGVKSILNNLKPVGDKTKIFVGIRNGITSIQSVFELQKIGIFPYAVDTATNNKIFHPKIYAAYSEELAHVIIGSANLTFSGLNQNLETSSYLILDKHDDGDKTYVDSLVETLCDMPDKYPNHVFQIRTAKQAVLLLREGRLEDERISRLPNTSNISTNVERDDLAPIPTFTKRNTKSNRKVKAVKFKSNNYGLLVWESKPLTERSLNIPRGPNTNITGDTNLGKGLMDNINFQHYFREDVFEDIAWSRELNSHSPHLERGIINSELVIKNKSYGMFEFEVTHDPRTNTRSYAQKNVMTKIRWGDVRSLIAKPDLLGRTLKLYKHKLGSNSFSIVID